MPQPDSVSDHRITAYGNSLTIDEMYFIINEIHFVDVILLHYPFYRNLVLFGAFCSLLTTLVCMASSSVTGTIIFGLSGIVGYGIGSSIKRRYALIIYQRRGTTQAAISTDRDKLEKMQQQIICLIQSAATTC